MSGSSLPGGVARLCCRAMVTALLLFGGSSRATSGENWPAWRGPNGDGTSLDRSVPITWDGREGHDQNIAWKRELPGKGHASPIVWGERIFLVAVDEDRAVRRLLCLDRADGRILWERDVLAAPLEEHHPLNGYASSTPATDGESVYVSFLDRDRMYVAAYEFDGNRLWEARPGPFASKHGYCSCPVLFEDLVIVNGDHDGQSFLAALDRSTGAVRWNIERENHTRSYSVPLIRMRAGRLEMTLSGNKCVSAYDPRTGRRFWNFPGPTEQFVATVVGLDDLVLLTCGYPERHVVALRPDGDGQLGDSSVVWRTTKGAGYVPSPIVVNDCFLVVADNGVANCFDARTGSVHWTERLGSGFSASIVSAEGRAYLTSDDGITTVVEVGPQFRKLAENPLGEAVRASPAIHQSQILIRGDRHLFCIGVR